MISSIVVLGCVSKRPRISCSDMNNMSSDTSYYISNRHYEGFIFPKDYKPLITVEEQRFTPTYNQIIKAEMILLEKEKKYGSRYKRQYIGSITPSGDSLVNIRIMKNGFKEECFDAIVGFGFGDYYEKNQRVKAINLSKEVIKE